MNIKFFAIGYSNIIWEYSPTGYKAKFKGDSNIQYKFCLSAIAKLF